MLHTYVNSTEPAHDLILPFTEYRKSFRYGVGDPLVVRSPSDVRSGRKSGCQKGPILRKDGGRDVQSRGKV